MSDAKHRAAILEAALAAFTRYGYRRVTMGDIAEGSGLSRPTLYNVFPNKEAVFVGVVRHVHEAAIEEIRERTVAEASLPGRLEIAFEVWLIRPYRMMHRSPDAKELLESTHAFASGVFEEAYREFESVLEGIIEPFGARLKLIDMTPSELARALSASGTGMKHRARDAEELEGLVSGLIRMTVASLFPSEKASRVAEGVA
jgi:AcrR family transcriptional regulator